MAFTPNVVDGNIILAAWGNEIRDRTRQIFATAAELNAQWPGAPNGSMAVTLDTYTVWMRRAATWTPVQQRGSSTYTTNGAGDCVVNFPVLFQATPIVTMTNAYEAAAYIVVALNKTVGVGPNGFTFRAWSTIGNGANAANANVALDWLATL